MTRIKICGITREEDALAALGLGVHALGFIFVPESPRAVTPARAAEILQTPGLLCWRVAVVRRLDSATLAALPRGFDAVQYYEPGDAARAGAGLRRIRALRVRGPESLREAAAAQEDADMILLDAWHPHKLGGSGEAFDWQVAREARQHLRVPLVLAGGLGPENVEQALEAVRPFAVDVSSGVEAAPGRKDHSRLRAFVEAVRRFDAREASRRHEPA